MDKGNKISKIRLWVDSENIEGFPRLTSDCFHSMALILLNGVPTGARTFRRIVGSVIGTPTGGRIERLTFPISLLWITPSRGSAAKAR